MLVLITAYNEENHVAEVVRGALEFLPVLVIDDGSTDQTSLQACLAGAEVLSQNQTRAKVLPFWQGSDRHWDQGYDAVLTLDADGQHDPQEIPAFLETFVRDQSDLIIGQR